MVQLVLTIGIFSWLMVYVMISALAFLRWPHFCFFISHLGFAPALLVAPLVLVGFYGLFSLDLLFPSLIDTPFYILLLSLMAPALVLYFSSGLATTLANQVKMESSYWKNQPCTRFALSLGAKEEAFIRPLLFKNTLTASLDKALPVIFSETLVIEAMFNIHGLFLLTFQSARALDWHSAGEGLLLIVMVYGAFRWTTKKLLQSMKKRTAGYA